MVLGGVYIEFQYIHQADPSDCYSSQTERDGLNLWKCGKEQQGIQV